MPDAYTDSAALSTIVTAYEQLAYFALRPELHFDQVASVKPTNETQPGASVVFTFWDDMAAATTALAETTDVEAVALSDSQVTVTLAEYGNAALSTAKARITSFLDVDAGAANLVGYNAGLSVDTLAREALSIGTNVVYATGGSSDPSSRVTVQVEDTITAADIRKVSAQLRGANVQTIGGHYVGMIHPDVSYDLRSESGTAAWLTPKAYVDPSGIYMAELGMFENIRWLETPRAKIWTGSGSAGINVYSTHIVGAQALAKGVSMGGEYGEQPQIVVGPVTDKLQRFRPIGWKHFVGYKVFREAAVRRIESSSSIA